MPQWMNIPKRWDANFSRAAMFHCSGLYSDPANLLDEQDTMENLPGIFMQEQEGETQPSWWNSTYFDEIYHARTGYEFTKGTVPYETSHPPLGKVLISCCIMIFGMTPFGWRFAGALAGILMLPGIYLLTKMTEITDDTPERHAENFEALKAVFEKQKDYLNSSRPTAVNLSWALRRMEKVFLECGENADMTMAQIKERLREEATAIRSEDVTVCRSIGEYGLTLLKPGDGVLTHCNAGQLATIKYGTATAPIYLAQEKGYGLRVFCDETRPLLQGARLTAYELHAAGVDVTLLCDNMSASLMKTGRVQAVFVGCDRVAANGDAANKIGTSVVATIAARYHVPF